MPLPNEEVTPPVTKMYLAIKNNLPTASLIFGEVIAVNKYDQRKFGIKSWGSCKDRRNYWGDEIWNPNFKK